MHHTNSVDSLSVHPSENKFIAASFDKTISIWDVEDIKKPLQIIKSPHEGGI